MDVEYAAGVVVGLGLEMEAAPQMVPGEHVRLQRLLERAQTLDLRASLEPGFRDRKVTRREQHGELLDAHRLTFREVHGELLPDPGLVADGAARHGHDAVVDTHPGSCRHCNRDPRL